MALNIDILSLWEIAFRWNGVDPHHHDDIKTIPLAVKDAIRFLAAEVYYEHLYSRLLLEREEEGRPERKSALFRKPIKNAISDFYKEFRACFEDNVIDKAFLKSVKIQIWEFHYWCEESNIPVPDFWLRSPVMGGNKLSIGNNTYHVGKDSPEESNLAEEAGAQTDNAISTQHQQAANIRHEPVNKLKQECVLFWLAHKSYSNNQAANKFYQSLPPDRQRLLSPSNAEITLARALSQYKNRDKQDKTPSWLQGFNPESS